MDGIAGTVATAGGLFAATNVDDLIVLTVLFLSGRTTGSPKPRQVWAGQYLGIAALVLVSVIAALGLTIVPDEWIGLLGLVPLALGVRGLVAAVRSRDHDAPPAVASGLLPIAGVTIANGADNISAYTPVFRTIGPASTLVTLAVFAAGVALWCLAASWLGSHKKVIDILDQHGRWLVPIAFITIGALIVLQSTPALLE
ncbi:cadmium resistance transporter [Actinomadura sp. WMMA1423]|uniref:cadmium resistance transporter n=1 Tax=Actinomadura sp. WMMA1423 TaxID=2591108 RepID=UPI0011468552|nr:cadmium resistance transporter [Actinomadura sp. WMMA1423]